MNGIYLTQEAKIAELEVARREYVTVDKKTVQCGGGYEEIQQYIPVGGLSM